MRGCRVVVVLGQQATASYTKNPPRGFGLRIGGGLRNGGPQFVRDYVNDGAQGSYRNLKKSDAY
jgi:hypothetical protein